MDAPVPAESSEVDHLDLGIIRALQVGPRAPFALLADVLGTSEQTVARRYRKLRQTGVLRVVGVVNPAALGQSSWIVRIGCRPSGAGSLASALAQRDDVGWVSLTGGGSEVTCALRSRTERDRDELLVHRLPRSAPVLSVAASVVLHAFVGGTTLDDWTGLAHRLSPADDERLRAASPRAPLHRASGSPVASTIDIDAADELLLRALTLDGRASYASLAAAAGISEGRATRRLEALVASGAVYLDTDLAARPLGFHALANLWLTVSPTHLAEVGSRLRNEPEVAFAAAITGPHNVTASITCRDLNALYEFVTGKVGQLPGVQGLEISPVLRHVKQDGSLTEGDRLLA